MKEVTLEELNKSTWKNYKPLLDLINKKKSINLNEVMQLAIPDFDKFEIINDLNLLTETEREKVKKYLIDKFENRKTTYELTKTSFELSLKNNNISNLSAVVVYSFGESHNDVDGRNLARKDILGFIKNIN